MGVYSAEIRSERCTLVLIFRGGGCYFGILYHLSFTLVHRISVFGGGCCKWESERNNNSHLPWQLVHIFRGVFCWWGSVKLQQPPPLTISTQFQRWLLFKLLLKKPNNNNSHLLLWFYVHTTRGGSFFSQAVSIKTHHLCIFMYTKQRLLFLFTDKI